MGAGIWLYHLVLRLERVRGLRVESFLLDSFPDSEGKRCSEGFGDFWGYT